MSKSVAIMQPYFMPYIGYFQLINAVDEFVVYDNIKYTKKGWINRNRILVNDADEYISLPLKKDSDFLDVRDRQLSYDFNKDKLLSKIRSAYVKAPHFRSIFPLIEDIIRFESTNLFEYIYNSIRKISSYLSIGAKISTSSEYDSEAALKGQDRVIYICKSAGADRYINAIGGLGLYSPGDFKSHGIELRFIRTEPIQYRQIGEDFVPWLSIIDVLMFNSIEQIEKNILPAYSLEEGIADAFHSSEEKGNP